MTTENSALPNTDYLNVRPKLILKEQASKGRIQPQGWHLNVDRMRVIRVSEKLATHSTGNHSVPDTADRKAVLLVTQTHIRFIFFEMQRKTPGMSSIG